MTFLRQLLILALVPLTAWSGMPHLACRCSNGNVRLFCSRMNLQANDRNSAACGNVPNSSEQKSCCGQSGGKCCGSAAAASSSEGSECCAAGCRCTPVYLLTDIGPTLKKVVLPELMLLDLVAISPTEIRLPRVPQVDLRTLEFNQRVPDDLIVLCERWLI